MRRGYLCESIGDPTAALAAIDAFRPHIVLYEWNLRRRDPLLGFAVTMREHASKNGRRIFIVALSVLDEPPGFCAQEQLDGYATKPVRLAELDAILRLAAGRRNRSKRGSTTPP
jgi:DNA-binding response OmpR family regulator